MISRDRATVGRHVDSPRRGDGDRTTETWWSHDRGSRSRDRGSRSWDRPILVIVGDTWTHDEPSIFIRRLSFKENVDRVMGHDSYGFARLDDADHIPKWTAHIARGIFLYKNQYISLLFSTLDWFVKQLSKFERRSWVHHDSPVFRLNHNPIGAGFVVIYRWIWSNFPLQHRTSARKKPRKFTSIRVNWRPIFTAIRLAVRFNPSSNGNLNFY